MNSSSPSIHDVPTQLCLQAESVLNTFPLTFVRLLQIALSIPTFIALFYLIRIYRKEPINFHPNLKLLMSNIVFFYLLHSLAIFFVCTRYEIIQLTYGNPCQFLTPIWMVFVTRIPSYGYCVAQPLFHFSIMMERLRATLFANRYEREGICCGLASTLGVWLLTLLYLGYVCATALEDQDIFGQPLILSSLTTKFNSNQILYVYFLSLFIIFVAIIGDYLITVKNRNIRSIPLGTNDYNLSQNFQVRENIVAMRLIFPTDVIYGLMFSIYMIGAVFVRTLYFSGTLTPIQYSFYYDLLNSFLFLYITISVLIYIYFIKFVNKSRRPQKVTVEPAIEQGEIYFQQLSLQWSS